MIKKLPGDVHAAAEPRIVLVIGNSNDDNDIGHQKNPMNDARLIATRMQSVGFQVFKLENADKRQMLDFIIGFGKRVPIGRSDRRRHVQ